MMKVIATFLFVYMLLSLR